MQIGNKFYFINKKKINTSNLKNLFYGIAIKIIN